MVTALPYNEKKAIAATVIFVLALVPFLQCVTFGAINFDDYPYALDNPFVLKGFTWDGIKYAFAGTRSLGIWFPLTMLSYQMDVSLGEGTAQTFHVSNLLWHGMASVALFLVIMHVLSVRFRDAAEWRTIACAGLATLFWAVHPQRVESVAWIASRKDLVSGFFAFLSLLFYLRAVGLVQITTQKTVADSHLNYPLSLTFLALSIMSKQTAMTLPLAMACAEWLAQKRISWKRLIFPMVMSASCVALALIMQSDAGMFEKGVRRVPMWDRCVTSLASIYYYAKSIVLPGAMSIFYPWPRRLEYGMACAGLAILGVFGWIAGSNYFNRRKNAGKQQEWQLDSLCLCVWFLGSLFPMLSIFMFGMHARADRFSYMPSVAISFGIGFVLVSYCRAWLLAGCLTCCIIGLGTKADYEAAFWENSVSVFERAVSTTKDNAKAYFMLASAYTMEQNKLKEARLALRRSIAIVPNSENLGLLAFLLSMQSTDSEREESLEFAKWALRLNPAESAALAAVGAYELRKGRWLEAERALEHSIRNQAEEQPVILEWLGLAKFNQKNYNGALDAFKKAAVSGRTTPLLRERIAATEERILQEKEGSPK